MPASPNSTATPPHALSVSDLTAQIKGLVEESFPDVWVAGEVSNLSRPSSGHCYLTLKDDRAQLRAVVWRGTAQRLRFQLTEGMEIVCHGRMDLYGPRGAYQLVIDQAEPQGVGALELAFRQLKEKLAAEGLFDAERKRPLPRFPRRVGVVTSPTGAAIRDFLEVLRRRWPATEVLVLPVRVQGDGAAGEVAAAVEQSNRLQPALDVLVVTRGGGSMEDLWAFNEAPAVRAIAASRVPTVSAVGHEIDVTLADLAADLRAATPTEAAERVAPSAAEMSARLRTLDDRARQAAWRALRDGRQAIDRLAAARPLARPHAMLDDCVRRLDELEAAAARSIRSACQQHRQRLATLAGKLETLSPVAVLSRGYSLVTNAAGETIRSSDHVAAGDQVRLRFADGGADATVESVNSSGPSP
ncbi:MAG: exodeoxyribonuclease VII large subunit [Planctomycetota bacterium]